VSKFLLNLLVQISKALVNSQIQFLFQKDFFTQPTGPFSLLAHLAPPASLFFLCLRRPSTTSTSHDAAPRPPRRPHLTPWSGPNRSSPSLPPPPLTRPHFLPLLHSSNGSIEDAIYHCCPAYPGHHRLPPSPIKGDEYPTPSPPLFPSLLSSLRPSVALTLSSSPRCSSPPLRRLSTATRAPVRPELGSPCSPLSVLPPHGELPCSGVVARPSSDELPPPHAPWFIMSRHGISY
jgi:hypothetical protein